MRIRAVLAAWACVLAGIAHAAPVEIIGHSARHEYVLLSSIEPRLHLAARIIMDFSEGKVRLP